jgi:hypothetical protein
MLGSARGDFRGAANLVSSLSREIGMTPHQQRSFPLDPLPGSTTVS